MTQSELKQEIHLRGVRVHNLKNISLNLPKNQLIVFTGVSGSGKSSLAFDTLYVEGQRRYIESLSTYARRHLGDFPKPDADHISGLTPTIAIEQKTVSSSPRSTVGTLTGIYDYLRVLFAKLATPYCPISNEKIHPQSQQEILEQIQSLPKTTKTIFLAPYARGKKGKFKEDFEELLRRGFTRIRLDGKIVDISEEIEVDDTVAHDIDYVIDRLVIGQTEESRLIETIKKGLELGNGQIIVLNLTQQEDLLFSEFGHSKKSGKSYPPLLPHDFSFNHPQGMCPKCQGLGTTLDFILDKIIDENLSIAQDCCTIASSVETIRFGNIYRNLARLYDFKISTPWNKLPPKAKEVFLYGTGEKWTRMIFTHPVKKTRWIEFVHWQGVLHEAKERFVAAKTEVYKRRLRPLMEEIICPDCKGSRLRAYPSAAKLQSHTLHTITRWPIEETLNFFQKLKLKHKEQLIGGELIKEITMRLAYLNDIGLHYLSLERITPTLSGGEAQRVRLASQIGSGLVDSTYILDEPSIGLHPQDHHKLVQTLRILRDLGNTIIVVEHDAETILTADRVVDIGPKAGEKGGEIIFEGSVSDLLQSPTSLTGQYLSGKISIPLPKQRRKGNGNHIILTGASHHNLKNVTASFPLATLISVTGVSGSGKSSLISDTLYPALSNRLMHSTLKTGRHDSIEGSEAIDKIIAIDQTPIGRTPRSNPATYIKVFDTIRDLFAKLPQASAFGFEAGRFSFNVKEGSCPHCVGIGMIKVDMDFLEDAWVTCQHCKGQRFDEKTLSILYKGKSIYDVLKMTIAEACDFFSSIPSIKSKLELLIRVGLDYLRLGQPSPTLSGGEAQRIKLAKELSRPSTGKTLYILDEPTTGLHFYDLEKLLLVLQALVDKGNTVIVIEHNMDLVKTSDWVIDLGPEGGRHGGEIIAAGTPEEIAKTTTATGAALKAVLKPAKLSFKKQKNKPSAIKTVEVTVKGAEQNNLKKVFATIPRQKITVCTGPSGSGKTSFALETIYAEGQRRYTDTLSAYARQFVKQSPKPIVEEISGLTPSIAIEQKSHAGSPRSTLGTLTEIYDYLRILYAHLGIPHCPETGEEIKTISKEFVCSTLLQQPQGTRLQILAPLTLVSTETFEGLKEKLQAKGYVRIRLNNTYYELDATIPYDKKRKNELFLVIDRLVIKGEVHPRLLEAIDHAASISQGIIVAAMEKEDLFFNLSFAVPTTGKSYPPITPHTFSFNTEQGMCLECSGLGSLYGADLMQRKELRTLSPTELLFGLWKDYESEEAMDLFEEILKAEGLDPYTPLKSLSDKERHFIFHGSENSLFLKRKNIQITWRGINSVFAKMVKSGYTQLRQSLIPLMHPNPCSSCKGSRLNPLARSVTIENLSLPDLCALPIEDVYLFFKQLKNNPSFLIETFEGIISRLHFLMEIGLDYLSLDRSAPTLSGGETQRIRLARQLGSGLTGCTYILDEPTIGLHPHDNVRLNKALKRLCELGNTLILVEHDPLTIALADYILDFGPKAGVHGGKICARGSLEEIKANPHSLTGAFLSGKKTIPVPKKRGFTTELLCIENASLHNLKNITVTFPIGCFSCVTGVSGSGKSSLINALLRPAVEQALASRPKKNTLDYLGATFTGMSRFEKILVLDQSPIGHTKRADVSTYVDLLTPLRHFFASLPSAKIKGLLPRHFSFNHIKGMCRSCWGMGTKTVHLQLLPPVKVPCDACHGYRLNPLSLEVTTQEGLHLGHYLNLTIEEAKEKLPPIPKVHRIIDTLISVGLGYLKLGQEIATLSGGEAQRIRLSKELTKQARGKILYLFDEPTTGLHSIDIAQLLEIFHSLVKKGHTLILIEHNLDIIANADYVIDLGPGAGKHGGNIVAKGTPEELRKNKASITGNYLH